MLPLNPSKSKFLGAALALVLSSSAEARDITGVGVAVGSLSNPYFVATIAGIRAKAKEITPQAKVTAVGSEYDLSKQVSQIESFISAGDQIVMISANDPVAIGGALRKAHDAGLVVAAFDVASAGADLTVTTDNVKAGEEACQYIVDHLADKKGNVIVLGGPQVTSVTDRVKGCLNVLNENPGIHILSDNQNPEASRDGGLKMGLSLLGRFPKVDAVFGNNDPTSIGFTLAAKQLGRKDFFITSVDGSPDIIPEVKDKNGLIKAFVAQDPFGMTSEAYRLAVEVAGGKPAPSKIVLLTPKLYSIENLESYKGWVPSPGE